MVITVGEILVGLGLIFGVLTGIAAFFGRLMNVNYLKAGTVSTNPLRHLAGVGLAHRWLVWLRPLPAPAARHPRGAPVAVVKNQTRLAPLPVQGAERTDRPRATDGVERVHESILMGRSLIALVLAGLALAAAYLVRLRRRVLAQGVTTDEARREMPGDAARSPRLRSRRRARSLSRRRPVSIWPWLVQMGPRPRAGAYTYAWIERLLGIDIENANRILPEYQHLGVGDFIALDRTGTQGLLVRDVQSERALALQWMPAGSSRVLGSTRPARNYSSDFAQPPAR